MLQQQGSQDVGAILSLDLVGNDHLLHHLVGDTRQGLLVQVQQHCTCGRTRTSGLWFAPKFQECVTMRDGLAELQQTAEGQRSHVRFPPTVRLLLHVFLKLDPSGGLLPLQLLVLVHSQLVQLHKDLQMTSGNNQECARAEARSKINHTPTLYICSKEPNS